MIDKNEIKKDLYKSKNNATFAHYVSGNIYYNIVVGEDLYQFPIPVVEDKFEIKPIENEDGYYINTEVKTGIKLSEDLGTTSFYSGMKGSDLNRWISKAIDKGEFIKIG